ncbi:DUF58 domain-containing protein [Allobacillus sp. SKP2-8]|uniref:DUF58 domain-containing protein n=1 Tax=unclassified Allobacillus TaxID=2628859 RepID=UPI001182C9D2|nr:DUF58 domain-containing protein [Allobacillus sp. SKP2-8]TSJ66333.1 DUF58 domain-containing protein [Allobacillus sp. SKP2-8]
MKQFQKDRKRDRFFYGFVIIGSFFIFFSFFGIFGIYSSLMLVGIFFYIIYLVNHLYEKYIDRKLKLINIRQLIRLYPGETGQLEIHLRQDGWLPMFGARLMMTYDQNIQMDQKPMYESMNTSTVEKRLNLFGRETKKIYIPFTAAKRGVARVRSLRIEIPSLFGYGKITLNLKELVKTEILMYPEVKEVHMNQRNKHQKMGEYQTNFSIYEDPVTSYGTRDYAPEDPLNRIHWKSTAKKQVFQTKVVERVNQRSWLILLNVRSEDSPTFTEQIEGLISSVAYLCRHATMKDIPYELLINVPKRGNIPIYHVPNGVGRDHYVQSLEVLARVNTQGLTASFDSCLAYGKSIAHFHPYVFHVGVYEQDHLSSYQEMEKTGTSVFVMHERFQSVWFEPVKSHQGVAK